MGRLRARVSSLLDRLATSLWFVPTLMALTGAAGGLLLVQIRPNLPAEVWWLHQGDGRDASGLLSSLLSSMITVTTLVISITMVVLTLAAGQLGPRLIRNFMRDLRTRSTLGLFVAAITYLVVVLRSLDGRMQESEVPHTAVTGGTAVVLASTFALLFYVHHLARSIVADTVINRVGKDLEQALMSAFPAEPPPPAPAVSPDRSALLPVPLKVSGYVQAIDCEAIVRCAEKFRALVVVDLQPGDHILAGEPRIWASSPAVEEAEFVASLRGLVLTGSERMSRQDPEFPVRQIVEVALRALSPSLNDPFTAIAAVDRLSAAIALLSERHDPQTIWCDAQGGLSLMAKTPSFDSVVDAAFIEIRRSAARQPAVLDALNRRLIALALTVRGAERRSHLQRHRLAVETQLAAITE